MADFYFDNICILYGMLLDAGSIAGAGRSPHGLHPGCVICHSPLLFPSYLYGCVKASYERLWQQEETFYCDVKTHPSNRWHRYERACMLYRICYLNFHRLSCFLSAYDRLHFQCTCNLWYVISEFLMKRIKYEESYIQTDGKCNFHTRQPYVQHFLYWFLIKGNLMDRGPSYETGGTSEIILMIVRRILGNISFTVTHQLWLFEISCSWCASLTQNEWIKNNKRTTNVKTCAVRACAGLWTSHCKGKVEQCGNDL